MRWGKQSASDSAGLASAQQVATFVPVTADVSLDWPRRHYHARPTDGSRSPKYQGLGMEL
jgi:hypothetical protein